MAMNLMGVVDNAFAGLLGTTSLAAYGLSFFITFVHAAPLMGLAHGVQALVARSIGLGNEDSAASYLYLGFFYSIAYGALIAIIPQLYLEGLLKLMTKDAEVRMLAESYLRHRFWGVFAIGITYCARGYWSSVGRPRVFLIIMLSSYLINGALTYFFISSQYGFKSLALGSNLATIFAAFINILWIKRRPLRLRLDFSRELLNLTLPSAAQQLLFALGFSVFLGIIGRIDANSLAAANVLISLTLFLFYPAMGFGIANASLVGKALGQKDFEKMASLSRQVLKASLIFFLPLLALGIAFRAPIITFFAHEPVVQNMLLAPVLWLILMFPIEVVGQIFCFSFLGVGKPRPVFLISVLTQWAGTLPFAFVFGESLFSIWCIHLFFRFLQGALFWLFWERETKKYLK